jgi:hypothetical protein
MAKPKTTPKTTAPAAGNPSPLAAPPDHASGSRWPWVVGTCYIVRTVTYHVVGRLVGVTDHELVFESAAWVADSGRWHEALTTGKLREVEPFPAPVIVGRGSVCDATTWSFPVPAPLK